MGDTTTRAYTLRLKGNRLTLWQNHVLFNRGVRVWGEWLLSLRGGLPASLADDPELLEVTQKEVKDACKTLKAEITEASVRLEEAFENAPAGIVKNEVLTRQKAISNNLVKEQLVAARRAEIRRILALSWLSPETPIGLLPRHAIVTTAQAADRSPAIINAFKKILRKKGAAAREDWVRDCGATLRAKIRPDAAWVDRTACFARLPKAFRPTEEEAATHLFFLFGTAKDYFATALAGDGEDKDYKTSAGNWVSKNWGEGNKSDNAVILQALNALLSVNTHTMQGGSGSAALSRMLKAVGADSSGSFRSLCSAIGWRGAPNKTRLAAERLVSASNVSADLVERFVATATDDYHKLQAATHRTKPPDWAKSLKASLSKEIGLPFKPASHRSHHFEYATMLAFAVRRVSQIHTKAKQAEAERTSFVQEKDRIRLVPQLARQWLDAFVHTRSLETGSIDGYQLRKRAIDGWPDVVKAWAGCRTADDRIAAVRELQADWEKGGDVQLFEALAADEAISTWRTDDGRGEPSILSNYVRSAVADQNAVRFKVPAYRHPDPLRSPVFIGFGNSQWSISYSAQTEALSRQRLLEKASGKGTAASRAKTALATEPILQRVALDLWAGEEMRTTDFYWQSKRLFRDLALDSIKDLAGEPVTRATRLGRSRVRGGTVLLNGITDKSQWNGRLQAPRRQLEDLARALEAKALPVEDEAAWPLPLRRRLNHINWFLTHSAKLTPSGPWLDLVSKGLPEGWQWVSGKKAPYLYCEANKARTGRAKHILPRIPGLRILSIDLGLRSSASAAVWQVVTSGELTASKTSADIVNEGELYCFCKSGRRTQVFRRIAAKVWARLDRQFLIQLDGEKTASRPATPAEWESLQDLRKWLGTAEAPRPEKLPPVDRLQQEAVSLCRQGLRRLSDIARIAFFLQTTNRPISGGRSVPMDTEARNEAAQDALLIWHSLVSSDVFRDAEITALWRKHVGTTVTAQPRLSKSQRATVRAELRGEAERLRGNTELADELAVLWTQRATEWKKRLRWLRDWVIPRFNKKLCGDRVRAARDIGGLSLDRIITIRGVYQLMRAYASRPEPQNLRAGVERLEQEAAKKLRPEFGRRMLTKMERLRENRVKQVASRIVEAALGVGSESRSHWQHGRKRPAAAINDPRFAPCHAVVIENLENYRPDELRTRRENRSLMNWSAGAVKKHLVEGCELHGIYLRQVSPAYTSRQDSRTGCPGMRCNDIPAKALLNTDGWMASQVKKAIDAVWSDTATPRQRLLAELAEAAQQGDILCDTVRIISPGGQLFVAADASSTASNGNHADLNAAANIGLVALLDPDWAAAWWRLPCKASSGEIDESKLLGAEAVPSGRAILAPSEKGKRGIVNAWCDPSGSSLIRRTWSDTRDYWTEVEERVVEILLQWNLRRRRTKRGALPF